MNKGEGDSELYAKDEGGFPLLFQHEFIFRWPDAFMLYKDFR